jgi:hypothetical protein
MEAELGVPILDQLVQFDLGIFAAHRVPSGWEILAPSSEPFVPAYACVAVLDPYGRPYGCGHDAPAPSHDHVEAAERD